MGIIDKVMAVGLEAFTIADPTQITSGNIVTKVLGWIGAIAGLIVFVYLIMGGFTYMTAGGNAEQSKKGGAMIVNAIVGLIIVLLAFGLTKYLVNILGGGNGVNP